MRYYSSGYPVFAATGDVAYEVVLAGCRGYCEGCHSPHTHDPNLGVEMNSEFIDKLVADIKTKYDKGFLDSINIIGGEPLDNSDTDLAGFISRLRSEFPKCNVWLYTHFEINEVEKTHPETLGLLDYIKCGKFEKSLYSDAGFKDEDTGVTLATSNQYIINVKEKYHAKDGN